MPMPDAAAELLDIAEDLALRVMRANDLTNNANPADVRYINRELLGLED